MICYLAHRYNQTFFTLTFAIENSGLTNVYQTFRKVFIIILLSSIDILVVLPCSIFSASRLRFTFSILNSFINFMKNSKTRISDTFDIIVVNNRNKNDYE